MEELISHPILKTSSDLITFLSFNSLKDFTKKMNELNSIKMITDAMETKNPEGEVSN